MQRRLRSRVSLADQRGLRRGGPARARPGLPKAEAGRWCRARGAAQRRRLEYGRHGRSIGGESPLEEEVVLTPSRRQLRRREAGSGRKPEAYPCTEEHEPRAAGASARVRAQRGCGAPLTLEGPTRTMHGVPAPVPVTFARRSAHLARSMTAETSFARARHRGRYGGDRLRLVPGKLCAAAARP